MKFASILKASGIKGTHKCSNIPIVLYDQKDRITSDEDVRYAEELFENNSNSFVKFVDLLSFLDENMPSSINIRIDESSVTVFYKTPNAIVFSRREPMNPIDYMG